MTTTVPSKALSGALAACAHAIGHDPARWNMPPLTLARTANAFLVRTGTRSGDVGITFRIPCETGGSWTVEIAGKEVKGLAKTLRPTGSRSADSPPVVIEHHGLHLVLVAGNRRISVPVKQVDDEVPEPKRTIARFPVVRFDDLADRIGAAMSWCCAAPGRDLVQGVHLYPRSTNESLDIPVMVATDGHRLLIDGDVSKTTELPDVFRIGIEGWTAASKAMAGKFTGIDYIHEVHGAENVPGGPTPNAKMHLVFTAGDRVVQVRLDRPNGTLPSWTSFLPPVEGDEFDVTCDRDDLLRVVKSASAMSTGSSPSCSMRPGIDGNALRIRVEGTSGNMEEDVAAEIRSTSACRVCVNPRYVTEALEMVRSPRIRIIQHESPLGAMRFLETPDTASTARTIVVMPVRGGDEREETAPVENVAETQPEEPPVEVPTGLTADEPSDEPDAYDDDIDQQPEHDVAV